MLKAANGMPHLRRGICLPNFTVNTVLDDGGTTTDGLISLREAIIAANTNAPFGDAPAGDATGDFITFDSSLDGETIELLLDSIPITENLAIRGTGVDVTIDAPERDWIFEINTDQQVSITGLALFGTSELFGQGLGGGGISMSGGGSLRITNSSFFGLGTSSNMRPISILDSSLFVVGSEFDSNYSGRGAAIRIDGGSSHLFESTFESNYGLDAGGALSFSGGTHTISNSEFRSNAASDLGGFGGEFGGAIYMINGADVDIFGGEFAGNSAGRGGAIYSSGDLSIWNNTVFRSNRATGTNDQTNFNADGGAIFSIGQLRMVDATVESNIAQKGAGIYLGRESLSLVNRTRFVNNDASISGGGIFIFNGNARLIDATIEGNEAGGNVVVDDGFTLSRQFLGDGGGIYFESQRPSSVLEINGGRITGNSTEVRGGGLFVASAVSSSFHAYVRIYNGTQISDNRTNRVHDPDDPLEPRGGGIYMNGSLLQVNDATIRNNETTGDGGGVYVQSGTNRFGNSKIVANQALWDGGGINIAGGNVRLYQTDIGGANAEDGNQAGEFTADGSRGFGGGVNLANENGPSRFFMIEGMVANNIAKIRGGGIHAANANNVVRLVSGVAVSTNRALVQDGGGIYNDGAHLEIRNANLSGNTSRNGGGIYQNRGSTHLTNSRIESNEARRTGGGVQFRGFFRRLTSVVNNNLAVFFPNIFNQN